VDMDKYYPYNSIGGDRVHDANDLAIIMGSLLTDGVMMTSATAMQIIAGPTSFAVTMKAGKCVVRGRLGVITGDKNITINNPSAANRIDRIVARADYLNRKTTYEYRVGTPGSTPVAPALKNDETAFDIPIARIRVNAGVSAIAQSDITDERPSCGIVTPGDVAEWIELIRGALAEDTAGNLLNMILDVEDELSAIGSVNGIMKCDGAGNFTAAVLGTDIPRRTTLWEGSWSSGDITVPNINNYSMFLVRIGATLLNCQRDGTTFRGGNTFINGSAVYTIAMAATISGTTLTLTGAKAVTHTASGSHSALSDQTISGIYAMM